MIAPPRRAYLRRERRCLLAARVRWGAKAPPMNVRAATAQDIAGIVDLHKAANPYGDWYRDPFRRLGRVAYEDLTPLERFLHGGSWMDLSLCRRHVHEYQRRGFPLLIAEDRGHVVGECEVWLDEEPEPFGRYAEAEMVESGLPPNADVERDLLTRAAERVRKMGYAHFDLSPMHSGGETVAKGLGFRKIWDTRTFSAVLKDVPRPETEFATRYLGGEYGDLAGLLLLNHREPARFRYEMLTALWPAELMAGVNDAQRLIAMAVDTPDGRFAVFAVRRDWLDPTVAEVDVWIDSTAVKDTERLQEAFSIAVEVARKLGTKSVTTYGPPSTAKVLRGLGFKGGDEPDLWLRQTL